MDTKEFLSFADKYKNWGRWGKDDEVGTMNFISPKAIVEACHVVRKGVIFSLAIPFDANGPQRRGRRFNPIHSMLRTGLDEPGILSSDPPMFHSTDDMVTMPLQCATQWDSLAHVMFKGRMYNDRPASMVDGQGAQKNSIDKVKEKLAGRGVLLDMPRHRGVNWLKAGEVISAEELDACCKKQEVTVKEGDFLLVRTGSLAQSRAEGGWRSFMAGWPGLGLSCVPWLYEKRVAAVCADCVAVEVFPHELDVRFPMHCVCLANMGMMLGEIFDFEKLADDCAQDGVYECLFVAPPLPITKAVGSPVNPYAIK